MTPLLSILCASVRFPFRDSYFLSQVHSTLWKNRIEFIMDHDNDWTSIGRKWQRMVQRARGEYIMRVDDDDVVHPQLLPLVWEHLDGENDCVTFNVAALPDKTGSSVCRINPAFDTLSEWEEDEAVQYRSWSHLCPTRRDLFVGVDFPNKSLGEDEHVMDQIRPKLKTYHVIPQTLYFAFPLNRNPYRRAGSQRYE